MVVRAYPTGNSFHATKYDIPHPLCRNKIEYIFQRKQITNQHKQAWTSTFVSTIKAFHMTVTESLYLRSLWLQIWLWIPVVAQRPLREGARYVSHSVH